jgi:hypothetical protein
MTVWMDAVDDTLIVPPFDGKIFLKASRISESVQRPPADSPRQLQQAPPRSSNISNVPKPLPIPKPPSSSETLLAFGSDDINENDMQSSGIHHVSSGSFMDSTNNDLIGLGSDSSINNIPKVHSDLTSLNTFLLPFSLYLTSFLSVSLLAVLFQPRYVRHRLSATHSHSDVNASVTQHILLFWVSKSQPRPTRQLYGVQGYDWYGAE